MTLFGLPPVLTFESPASWISRAALSQGVTAREFRRHLKLSRGTDSDLAFTRRYVRDVMKTTGLPPQSFQFSQHMLTSLRNVDPHGKEFLLGNGPTASYRFCPTCLVESAVKYFQLHWRFKAWRWCPLHHCMLSDKCPHCSQPIHLPGEMLYAGSKRQGVASLDRCLACTELLTTGWNETNGTLSTPGVVLPWEETLLDNGRAALAALYFRKVYIDGEAREFSLSALRRIQRNGLLPHGMFTLNQEEISRRIRTIQALNRN